MASKPVKKAPSDEALEVDIIADGKVTIGGASVPYGRVAGEERVGTFRALGRFVGQRVRIAPIVKADEEADGDAGAVEAGSQAPTVADAAEALDSLDDYARMTVGVDAKGPREMLERFIAARAIAENDEEAANLFGRNIILLEACAGMEELLDQAEERVRAMGEEVQSLARAMRKDDGMPRDVRNWYAEKLEGVMGANAATSASPEAPQPEDTKDSEGAEG